MSRLQMALRLILATYALCFFVFMMNGCQAAKNYAKGALGDEISEQIEDPVAREKFDQLWMNDDLKAALGLAAKEIGDEALSNFLADRLRSLGEENESLAAQLEEQGLEALVLNWAGFGSAILAAIVGALGWKGNSTKGRIANMLINAIGAFSKDPSTNGAANKLTDTISTAASSAGLKAKLDKMVNNTGARVSKPAA